jgi:hypothetical protein
MNTHSAEPLESPRWFVKRLSCWGWSLLLVLCIVGRAASAVPNEQQLVALYCKTAENWPFQKDRWVLRFNLEERIEGLLRDDIPNKLSVEYTVYRDTDRLDHRQIMRRAPPTEEISSSLPEEYQDVTSDGRRHSYANYTSLRDPLRWIRSSECDISPRVVNGLGYAMASMQGYAGGELKSLSVILKEASSKLSVRPSVEVVNGFSTYVLEGSTPYGHYTMWLDPNCGYCPRRMSVAWDPDDLFEGKPVSSPRPTPPLRPTRLAWPSGPYKEISFLTDVSEVENIGGTYIPTEATTVMTMTYADGSVVKRHNFCKCLRIDFAPDFTAIPDAFVLDAPDGTPVHDLDFPAARHGGQSLISD